MIIDLYGNPVVHEMDNYRLFIIYHLKTLKALDGLAIVSSQIRYCGFIIIPVIPIVMDFLGKEEISF